MFTHSLFITKTPQRAQPILCKPGDPPPPRSCFVAHLQAHNGAILAGELLVCIQQGLCQHLAQARLQVVVGRGKLACDGRQECCCLPPDCPVVVSGVAACDTDRGWVWISVISNEW